MKPGYQSTEFWITFIGQLLALLALTGAINVGDKDKLETALANAVTAIFTLISSTIIVVRYIRSRTELKSEQLSSGTSSSGPLVLPVALLACFLLAAPAHAEPPAAPACFFGGRQRTDPALLALLQQLAQNQQTIIALLQQQQRAPTPAQPLIVLVPAQPGGALRQDIPLGGAPRQDIPLGGAPRQDIQLGQPPRQDIPLGTPPRQEIPLGPPPRQNIPPPAEVKPSGMQRYIGR